ncbi:hematopoietic death receptor isoform X2 [Corythoichthys intestinalis]|uniref:hematopoietic death receptor isoform X2 n=1 Tax=Corythoichthys intestinalis TaxID=161448 RepID=UPI0025A5D417|nr:hematopoietic death receptor isoform X2 [Corythoichthys intestinalis]
MNRILPCIVIGVFVWSFSSTVPFPTTGLHLGDIPIRRTVICKNGEYRSNNICCKYCPAGTHLKSDCTVPGEKGQCEECEDETYTEHDNHLQKCIGCTQCRSDQEIAQACSKTRNSICRCKEGGFCTPEQPCEMCKKCLRCRKDEKVVRNCTATSNTECKKIPLQSEATPAVISVLVIAIASVVVAGAICIWKKKQAGGSTGNVQKNEQVYLQEGMTEQTQRNGCSLLSFTLPRVSVQSSDAKDECQALFENSNSSASNSQQNLTSLPLASAQQVHLIASQPILKYEPFPELFPVNGEESLRKCFQYFEEISIAYYKRFFRELGLNNNVIKTTDQNQYEDRIHELLSIWYEKEGKCASINDLLKALLVLDQRLTAESIKEKALEDGHYILEKSL